MTPCHVRNLRGFKMSISTLRVRYYGLWRRVSWYVLTPHVAVKTPSQLGKRVPWRWRQYYPNRLYLFTKPHGVTYCRPESLYLSPLELPNIRNWWFLCVHGRKMLCGILFICLFVCVCFSFVPSFLSLERAGIRNVIPKMWMQIVSAFIRRGILRYPLLMLKVFALSVV